MLQSKPAQKQRQRKPKQPRRKQAPTGISPMPKQIKAPVNIGVDENMRAPRQRTSRNGNHHIAHTELIQTVTGTDAFSNATIPINPGLNASFPWLSAIAPNYESYKFKKLVFRFVNSIGSQTPGTIYMVPEFDVHDAPPTSEQQISSYEGCSEGSVWTRHTYNCAKHNLSKRSSYLVRTGLAPANTDLSLYDVGFLNMATVDCGSTLKIGKVWVDYEIELQTPQMGSIAVGNALSAKISDSDKFLSNPTLSGNAPLTATATGGVLTITALRSFQCNLSGSVSGATLTAATFSGTAVQATASVPTSTAATLVFEGTINFVNPGDTYIVTAAGGTYTTYALQIAQYNLSN